MTAQNASGYGTPSEEASDTPGSGTSGLDTPVIQTSEAVHHRMVKLDWDDVDGADGYEVQFYLNGSEEWVTLPTDDFASVFNGSNVVVSGLPENDFWFFQVRATGCGGLSEWSEILMMVSTKATDWEDVAVPTPEAEDTPEPKGCPPGTPVLHEAEVLRHRKVKLAWDAVDGASSYEVQLYNHGREVWVDLPTDDVGIVFNDSSAVVSGLLPKNSFWHFQVSAVNAAGGSGWSEIVQVVPTKASDWESEGDNSPVTDAPTISATAHVGETLTVETSGIADPDGLDDASYSYQWIRNDGTTDADIQDATCSIYALSADDLGKTIKVRVSFTDDGGGEEALTSAATATVVAATVPDEPGHLRVFPHDAQGLELSWEEPTGDGGSAITGYKVRWKESTDSWETPEDVSEETVTGRTYTINGLTDGVEYTVRVLASHEVGDGDPSDEESGTPRETTPPELSTATADGATLTLTYNETLDGASEPAADASAVTVGGADRTVNAIAVSGSKVTLTLAAAVTSDDMVTVSYTVPTGGSATPIRDLAGNAAASFSGESVTHNAAEAQEEPPDNSEDTQEPQEPPPAPQNLTAVENEDGSVSLRWDAPDDDGITGYQILRRQHSAGENALSVHVEDTGSTATIYTDMDVSPGVKYVYRVKAINDAGVGERSRRVRITTSG